MATTRGKYKVNPFEESLRALAENPPEEFLDALASCLETYLMSFSFFSKRIWHDFVVTVLSRNLPLFAMIEEVDATFLSLLTEIIGKYRDKPAPELIVRNLYSMLLHNFMVFISTEGMGVEELRDAIMRQVEVLFMCWEKPSTGE